MKSIIYRILHLRLSGIINLIFWSGILTLFVMNDKFQGPLNLEIFLVSLYLFCGITLINGLFFFIFRLLMLPLSRGAEIAYFAANLTVFSMVITNYLTVLIYGKQLGMEGFVMTIRGWQGGELGDFTTNVFKLLLFIIVYLLLFMATFRFLDRILDRKYLNLKILAFLFGSFFLITLILLGIIYYVLSNYTDSDVPLADAVTTSIFFVGMYFMALKKIENWIYWIVADVISVPLYFYKGLVFTSFQFLVFLVLAVMGLLEWQKRLKQA